MLANMHGQARQNDGHFGHCALEHVGKVTRRSGHTGTGWVGANRRRITLDLHSNHHQEQSAFEEVVEVDGEAGEGEQVHHSEYLWPEQENSEAPTQKLEFIHHCTFSGATQKSPRAIDITSIEQCIKRIRVPSGLELLRNLVFRTISRDSMGRKAPTALRSKVEKESDREMVGNRDVVPQLIRNKSAAAQPKVRVKRKIQRNTGSSST